MGPKLQQIVELYALAADTVTTSEVINQLSPQQQVQMRQYWNEVNMWMTYYKPLSSMPCHIQNKVIGSFMDMAQLLRRPLPGSGPLNVLALHLTASPAAPGWGIMCKQDTDEILQLFQKFGIPLPKDADQLTSDALCRLLAEGWPHGCMNGWKPVQVLGRGHEGVVYAVCQLGKCDAVAKLEQVGQPPQCNQGACPFTGGEMEMYIQKAAGTELAPEVLDFFICSGFRKQTGLEWTVLVMRQYDGNLKQLIESGQVGGWQLHQVLTKLVPMLFALAQKGITHRDLHSENVLYRRKGGELEFVLTDFGFAYMKSLGFWNRDVSSYKRYMPTQVNVYYDLAYLLRDLRQLTSQPALQLPGLTETDAALVKTELCRIEETLRS